MEDELNSLLPPVELCKSVDERYMRQAFVEAIKAYDAGEVPVGCVIVKNDAIIGKGYNQVEMLQDPTAHAEMIAVTSATSAISGWRLQGATVYCTLEPCMMCFGAMHLARISKLVYAADDLRHGVCGSWVDLCEHKHPIHAFEIEKGIFKELSAIIMKNFFKNVRSKKKMADEG